MARRLLLFAVIFVLTSSFSTAQNPPGRVVKKTILDIPSTGETVETALALQEGETYLVEAQGIYTYAPGGRVADPEFAYDPDVTSWFELGAGAPETADINLDLLINGTHQDWLGSSDGKRFLPHTFSPNHTYRVVLVGNGQPISFRIHDTSYDWNEGSLTVSISRLKGSRRP